MIRDWLLKLAMLSPQMREKQVREASVKVAIAQARFNAMRFGYVDGDFHIIPGLGAHYIGPPAITNWPRRGECGYRPGQVIKLKL